MEAIIIAIILPIVIFALYYTRKVGAMFGNTAMKAANRINDIASVNLLESKENLERRYTEYKIRQETNNYRSLSEMREEARHTL